MKLVEACSDAKSDLHPHADVMTEAQSLHFPNILDLFWGGFPLEKNLFVCVANII